MGPKGYDLVRFLVIKKINLTIYFYVHKLYRGDLNGASRSSQSMEISVITISFD